MPATTIGIEELIKKLGDSDPLIRESAARELVGVTNPVALTALLGAVSDPHPGVSFYARKALKLLQYEIARKAGLEMPAPEPLPGTLKELLALTSGSDEARREEAVEALVNLKDPASLPRLLELTSDTNPRIQYFARKAILAINEEIARKTSLTSSRPAVDTPPATGREESAYSTSTQIAEHSGQESLKPSNMESPSEHPAKPAPRHVALEDIDLPPLKPARSGGKVEELLEKIKGASGQDEEEDRKEIIADTEDKRPLDEKMKEILSSSEFFREPPKKPQSTTISVRPVTEVEEPPSVTSPEIPPEITLHPPEETGKNTGARSVSGSGTEQLAGKTLQEEISSPRQEIKVDGPHPALSKQPEEVEAVEISLEEAVTKAVTPAGEFEEPSPADEETRIRKRIDYIQEVALSGDKTKLPVFLKELQNEENEFIRATLIKAIGKLGHKETANLLIPYLKDPDERVIANTIEALEMLKNPKSVEAIVKFTAHRDNRIRANAVKAVWSFASKNPLARRLTIGKLREMISSNNADMRESAIYVLGEIGATEAIDLISMALSDKVDSIRNRAREVLEKLQKLEGITPEITEESDHQAGIAEKTGDMTGETDEGDTESPLSTHEQSSKGGSIRRETSRSAAPSQRSQARGEQVKKKTENEDDEATEQEESSPVRSRTIKPSQIKAGAIKPQIAAVPATREPVSTGKIILITCLIFLLMAGGTVIYLYTQDPHLIEKWFSSSKKDGTPGEDNISSPGGDAGKKASQKTGEKKEPDQKISIDRVASGRQYLEEGFYPEAINIIKEELKDFPDNQEARDILAEAYFKRACELADLDIKDSARGFFVEALKVKPSHFEANVRLGQLFFDENDFKQAQKYFLQAAKIRPDDASVSAKLGDIAYSLNDRPAAIKYYQKAVEQDRNGPTGKYAEKKLKELE